MAIVSVVPRPGLRAAMGPSSLLRAGFPTAPATRATLASRVGGPGYRATVVLWSTDGANLLDWAGVGGSYRVCR